MDGAQQQKTGRYGTGAGPAGSDRRRVGRGKKHEKNQQSQFRQTAFSDRRLECRIADREEKKKTANHLKVLCMTN